MAFDLSDLLKGVSESDTGREQIEYIRLDLIDEDSNNFYQLSDIPLLADNISLCGLQQPIRVRQKADNPERYVIVSGHRRRAALEMLVADGHERWRDAPCIVERDKVSPALQQLRLIYANASTRKLTPAETSEQALQVERLLYQLKEEGYEFPGRMRDHVAEAVGASKSKLARLKVIREKLAHCWESAWKDNLIAESTAYALAQLPKEWQEIIWGVHKEKPQYVYQNTVENEAARIGKVADLQCTHGCAGGCQNVTAMMIKNAKEYYSYCTGCCFECSNLRTCRDSCALAAGRKKELRDTEREANRAAAERQEERERPGAEFAKLVYQRIGLARKRSGTSVQKLFEVQKKIYSSSIDDPREEAMESGKGKYSPTTYLPFGYSMQASSAMMICAVADALECSVDYLLGRTDMPDLACKEKVSDLDTGWYTGEPAEEGAYVVLTQFDEYCAPIPEKLTWDGQVWCSGPYTFDPESDGKIIGWMKMPEVQ